MVEMKETSEAAIKGVLLGDRLHQINGVALPLALGHKHVRERVKTAKRPMHLILERMQQEAAYVGGAAAMMAAAALAAAEEEEKDALVDLKGALLASGSAAATAHVSSWKEDAPLGSWKGVKVEQVKRSAERGRRARAHCSPTKLYTSAPHHTAPQGVGQRVMAAG